ncbi:MAG: CoA-binding protein [bacterium]
MREINDPATIEEALATQKPVAVVGLSPKPHRNSYKIAQYLIRNGYEVIGVHPRDEDIPGVRVVTDLTELKDDGIEVVDVFLNPDRLMPVVEQAVEIGAKILWLQLGVINEEAAEKARQAGLYVVMDHCIRVEHGKRF